MLVVIPRMLNFGITLIRLIIKENSTNLLAITIEQLEQLRERAVTIGIGFTSDCLRNSKWREYLFKRITERSNAKLKQTRITFDNQVPL